MLIAGVFDSLFCCWFLCSELSCEFYWILIWALKQKSVPLGYNFRNSIFLLFTYFLLVFLWNYFVDILFTIFWRLFILVFIKWSHCDLMCLAISVFMFYLFFKSTPRRFEAATFIRSFYWPNIIWHINKDFAFCCHFWREFVFLIKLEIWSYDLEFEIIECLHICV